MIYIRFDFDFNKFLDSITSGNLTCLVKDYLTVIARCIIIIFLILSCLSIKMLVLACI